MQEEKNPTSFTRALDGLAGTVREEPLPCGWIRKAGRLGEYTGRGRSVRIPYRAFIALLGFDEAEARIDQAYAYRENIKAIVKAGNACPYKGALVITDVPDIGGAKYTFTLLDSET